MSDISKGRTSSFENFGKLRSQSELFPEVPKGKGKFGSTELSLPTTSEKFGNFPFPLQEGPRRKNFGDLRANANRLMIEIEKGEAQAAALAVEEEPFKHAFYAANDALAVAWASKRSGKHVSKAQMLAIYDARVSAGHDWNPYRARYQDALRWLKTLRMELKDVNYAIGT